MVKKPDKEILDYKKSMFLIKVGESATSLGVPTPKVKFWNHYENHFNEGERAHIHLETNTICISEPELERMSEEEINKTASHEVSHLHHIGHGWEFQKTHLDTELSLFKLPSGTIGALPEGYKPPKEEKERKSRPVKYKCNYCNKKGKTKKCKYCGNYFCEEHIKPQEPIIGETPRWRIDEKNTHPCFVYSRHLDKKRKEENEKYKEALEKLCQPKKKSDGLQRDIHLGSLTRLKERRKGKELEKKIENRKNDMEKIIKEMEDGKIEIPSKKKEKTKEIPWKTLHPKEISISKKQKKKTNKTGLIILILIIFSMVYLLDNFGKIQDSLVEYLHFKYLQFGDIFNNLESKNMSSLVFEEINDVREDKTIGKLVYNKNSYGLAVNIAKRFYESGTYSLKDSELKDMSKKDNLENIKFLSRKLDKLDKSNFDMLSNDWTTKNLFIENTLNPIYTDGAVGCYREVCVMVMSTTSNPSEIIVSKQPDSPQIYYNPEVEEASNYKTDDYDLNDFELNLPSIEIEYDEPYCPPLTKSELLNCHSISRDPRCPKSQTELRCN